MPINDDGLRPASHISGGTGGIKGQGFAAFNVTSNRGVNSPPSTGYARDYANFYGLDKNEVGKDIA